MFSFSFLTNLEDAYRYNNRGHLYTNQGRYNDAVADFDRAIELDPTQPVMFHNRRYHHTLQSEYGLDNLTRFIADGLDAFNAGNYGQAVEEFTQAVNVPQYFDDYSLDYAYAHFNLGRTHIELENYDLAQAEFAEALALNPDLTLAVVGQGDVYALHGNWVAALERYGQAIEQRPTLPDSYLKRGIAYAAQGDQRAAAADYWTWIQRNETHDVVWDYYQFGQSFVVQIDTTWSYYVPVNGEAGQLFSASAETLLADNPVDPLLVLLDPDGVPIAANNDASSITLDAVLENVVLPVDGEYTLVASHAVGSDGPVELTLKRGGALSAADLTATVNAYTPTPTVTSTSTPTATPSPTATPDSAATEYEHLGTLPTNRVEAFDWQNDVTVITFDGLYGIHSHTVAPTVGGPAQTSLNDMGYASAVAISPDGSLLVTASKEITVYDAATGEQLAFLPYHTNYVHGLTFNADGSVFFSGDSEGQIAVWDATTFELLTGFETDLIAAYSLATDSTGQWLAIADPYSSGVELWGVSNPASPRLFMTLVSRGQSPGGEDSRQLIAFSPDGSLLAGISGNDVLLWDMQTFIQVAKLSGHTDKITSLAFNHDGTLLATGSEDRTIRLWYVPHRSEIAVLSGPQTNNEIQSLYYSPGKDLLAALYSGEIHIWGVRSELTEGLPTPTPTIPPTPTLVPSLTLTPDPAILKSTFTYLGDLDFADRGTLRWRDADTILTYSGQPPGIRAHSIVPSVGMAPVPVVKAGLNRLVVDASPVSGLTAHGMSEVELVDMYSGETMAMLDREGNGMSDLVFGAGGTRLAALSNDRILSIWDTTTYELLDSRQLNQVSPNNVAYDPTGHYLAILEWFVSPKIAVWDISDPANPGDIQVLIEDIETPGISLGNKIVFSPNGSLLAAINGADIIVWETATWNQLGVIDGHKYAVTSLDFNYDGMLLASGSEDRTVRIWHIPSLTEIAVLGSPEENGQIAEVYFNPARNILAARFDNKISLWSLDIPSSQTAPDVIPLPTQISAPDPVITCPIHTNEAVNLREGPGTTFAVSGALEAGLTAIVDGQTTDDEGFIWWHLARGVWVRADVVEALGDCENVPYLPDE